MCPNVTLDPKQSVTQYFESEPGCGLACLGQNTILEK